MKEVETRPIAHNGSEIPDTDAAVSIATQNIYNWVDIFITFRSLSFTRVNQNHIS